MQLTLRPMLRALARLCALALGLAPALPAWSQGAMSFTNECTGRSASSCFIVAEGDVELNTGEQFRQFLRDEIIDGNRVLLSSRGGSLWGGLELGRAIREAGMETEIGRFFLDPDSFEGRIERDATCASACAYAFLGGTLRQVHAGAQLGFHQFYIDSSLLPATVAASEVSGAMTNAQAISSKIVAFLLDMNVDPRVFVLGTTAGPNEMLYPDAATLARHEIVTPGGFAPFYLEPFGNGVVAASRRQGPARLYDTATQVTALCRSGAPLVLLSAGGDLAHLSGGSMALDGGNAQPIPRDRLRQRAGSAEIALSREQANALAEARQAELSVGRGMASGGDIKARLQLDAMDRAMLAAAFRLCI
ncbi:MAG: hypothetical protein ACXIVE_06650 [Salinarimonas sp.]